MSRWQGSPQYLKHLQKIRSLDPSQRAVTRGLIDELSSVYAAKDMQTQLAAMREAAVADERENQLDLGQQRLDLREDANDYAKDQNKTAEILGYANIPLSALSGYGDYRHKKKLTGLYKNLAERY